MNSTKSMACTCHSYNRPDIGGDRPEVVLLAPAWSNKKTICVDACIADVINALWANGVVTLGSCCGHNHLQPSVVVESEPERCARLLKTIDSTRAWEVMHWRLCTVTEDGTATPVPILK